MRLGTPDAPLGAVADVVDGEVARGSVVDAGMEVVDGDEDVVEVEVADVGTSSRDNTLPGAGDAKPGNASEVPAPRSDP